MAEQLTPPDWVTAPIPASAYSFELLDDPEPYESSPVPDAAGAFSKVDYSFLNDQQREAVDCDAGPLVIIAGAGTGKTGTLVYRTARLIELGTQPSEILLVTFTNKAAKEIVNRLVELIGPKAKRIWAGTFHALCLRILRAHAEDAGLQHRDFQILDEGDVIRVLKVVYCRLGLRDDKKIDTETARMRRQELEATAEAIASAKDAGLTVDDAATQDGADPQVISVWREYESEMRQRNAVDFADLIQRVILLFNGHPAIAEEWSAKFRQVMADEMQDTNPLQFSWLRLMAAVHGNIAVVGDAAQSIYRWRGADPKFLVDFKTYWPNAKTVVIDQNYRSTQEILDVANNVLNANTEAPKKTLRSPRHGPAPTVQAYPSEYEEATAIAGLVGQQLGYGVPPNEIAILVRSRQQFGRIEEALRVSEIPYGVVGGPRFYERAEIADAIAYLRLIVDPHDDLAYDRAVRAPKRKAGDATIDTIIAYAKQTKQDLLSASVLAADERMVPSSSHPGLRAFVDIINGGLALLLRNETPGTILRTALENANYSAYLAQTYEPDNYQERIAHLEDLFIFADRFKSPAAFLQHAALMSATEDTAEKDEVVLATVHAAKGTEYDCVIVPAFEMGRFPNALSLEGPGGVEEERNLAHVAFTRARHTLAVTHAESRFGKPTEASPFIAEAGLQPPALDDGADIPFDLPASTTRQHYRAAAV